MAAVWQMGKRKRKCAECDQPARQELIIGLKSVFLCDDCLDCALHVAGDWRRRKRAEVKRKAGKERGEPCR